MIPQSQSNIVQMFNNKYFINDNKLSYLTFDIDHFTMKTKVKDHCFHFNEVKKISIKRKNNYSFLLILFIQCVVFSLLFFSDFSFYFLFVVLLILAVQVFFYIEFLYNNYFDIEITRTDDTKTTVISDEFFIYDFYYISSKINGKGEKV